jgi:hypothetical protein
MQGNRQAGIRVSCLIQSSIFCRPQETTMSHSSSSMQTAAAFEIRFQSLFNQGRALAFPCDSTGMVNLDAMSERARNNYLFARGMIGREYATPFVQAREPH